MNLATILTYNTVQRCCCSSHDAERRLLLLAQWLPKRYSKIDEAGRGNSEDRFSFGLSCQTGVEAQGEYVTPQEIVDIRAALESLALQLAIPDADTRIVRHAGNVLDDLDTETDVSRWSSLNWEFHSILYQPALRPRQRD